MESESDDLSVDVDITSWSISVVLERCDRDLFGFPMLSDVSGRVSRSSLSKFSLLRDVKDRAGLITGDELVRCRLSEHSSSSWSLRFDRVYRRDSWEALMEDRGGPLIELSTEVSMARPTRAREIFLE